ncbi:hypothetical protein CAUPRSCDRAFT_12767, partial [Caulochytrium protostelioides]
MSTVNEEPVLPRRRRASIAIPSPRDPDLAAAATPEGPDGPFSFLHRARRVQSMPVDMLPSTITALAGSPVATSVGSSPSCGSSGTQCFPSDAPRPWPALQSQMPSEPLHATPPGESGPQGAEDISPASAQTADRFMAECTPSISDQSADHRPARVTRVSTVRLTHRRSASTLSAPTRLLRRPGLDADDAAAALRHVEAEGLGAIADGVGPRVKVRLRRCEPGCGHIQQLDLRHHDVALG